MTEADVVMDDETKVSPLDKLHEYLTSAVPLQRAIILRDIVSICVSLGFHNVSADLLPHLSILANDSEVAVRQVLAQNIGALGEYLAGLNDEAAYESIIHSLLPVVVSMLKDSLSHQVVELAQTSIVKIAAVVTPGDRENHILKVIKGMAESDDADQRMTAPKLMADLAGLLGEDITKEHLVPDLVKLAADPMFRVRKATAQNMGGVCAAVGAAFTASTLLPVYLNLSRDEIWGVRKACVESLVSVSQACDSEIRGSQLVSLFERFSEDVSRWVKNCAFQNMGQFIATLKSSQITPKFLQTYTAMADPNGKSEETDVYSYCAFSFPAVLLTVGPQRWSELSQAYLHLVKDVQWKVRRTLSHSLHEVAKILGTEITENILVPISDLFLKDLDEVKVGVLKNFANFLRCLTPASRERYLSLLNDPQVEIDNWRFRKILAAQIGAIADLFNPTQVKAVVIPFAMSLARDKVAMVRNVTVNNFGALFRTLISRGNNDTENTQHLVQLVTELAEDNEVYQHRQVFIGIVEHIANFVPDKFLIDNFSGPLLALATDPVPNVRLKCASAISTLSKKGIIKDQSFSKALRKFREEDEDEDVVFFANVDLQGIPRVPDSP
eukprot:comp21072_c0_seq1/m.44380 comp21072_c0_seq1/g.44380  ORF comp21072_c0_seq1/g.44380 comp21072_c0_seq1/m.44380 type:complete len:611 (+) comp21072_c0_seq1:46-1878(+)